MIPNSSVLSRAASVSTLAAFKAAWVLARVMLRYLVVRIEQCAATDGRVKPGHDAGKA
jgi:hypothetical protein